MKILGFNCFGHDSAATLVVDDEIVFAIEEERLNRKKHSGGFPELSINACLDYAHCQMQDIQHIGFFWKPTISISKIPVYLLKFWNKVPNLLKEQRSFEVEENLGMLNYLKDMFFLPQYIREKYKLPKNTFKFHYIEHHLSHAASAFYPSAFEESAILTIDGAGEWTTTMLAKGHKNKITKIETVDTPYSLGAFYQAISKYLGFKLIEGPGKLMGLASYGNPNSDVYEKMKKLIHLKPKGKFTFDMSYFSYHYTRKSGVSEKFVKLFGEPKQTASNWSDYELDIAAAAQHIVEDIVQHALKYLKEVTQSDNLCMAGGVALNSVTNGIVAKSNLFKNIFIQPAAGDSGTSLGAALWVNHAILNRERRHIMKTASLGYEYNDSEYLKAIRDSKLPFITTETNQMETFIAKKIYENKIIAWFQGRMEFGPRALGNRSILANPLHPQMKDILNQRVKFRENFRPFAAIVTEEDCGKYFDHDYPNPFMLLVYHVKPEYKTVLPSITHVDGTTRIQTVNHQENAPLYGLLKAVEKVSGHPVVINTSFNIKGEPIVCSPQEAINSFINADMDYLVMGNHIVSKEAFALD
jgi:carbamoyltransferase